MGAFALLAGEGLQAQWVQTNPTYDYGLSTFAVLDSTIFGGMGDGSIVRSSDMGASWSDLPPLSSSALLALAVSGRKLFAGVEGGILLSTDGGLSWQKVLTLYDHTQPGVAALAAVDSDLYAGVTVTDGVGRIYHSTDLGLNWTDVSAGINCGKTYALAIIPRFEDTVILAGTDHGNYRSSNAGSTWSAANQGLLDSAVTALLVLGDSVLVGSRRGVSLSTDDGVTWTSANSSVPGHEISSLAAVGSEIFAGTWGEGILSSTDGGKNWSEDVGNLPNKCVNALASAGASLFAGYLDGTIARSTDSGANWGVAHAGRGIAAGIGLITSCKHEVFARGSVSLYRLSRDGVDWIPTLGGFRALAVYDSTMYVSSDSGVSISTNGGRSWVTPRNESYPRYEQPLGFATIGTNIFLANYPIVDLDRNAGVYVSKDNGMSWDTTSLKSSLITFVSSHGNSVYACVGGVLWSSEDTGRSWHSYTIPSPPPLSSPGVLSIAFRGSEILVGSTAGMVRSSDGGHQWSSIASGKPGPVFAILVRGDDVFVTSDSSVYHLDRGDTSWAKVGGAFPSIGGYLAALAADDSFLYASFGTTVWKRPLSQMIAEVSQRVVNRPQDVSLSQNYPNPFNPTTRIDYVLHEKTLIDLSIFDVLGRKVAVLYSGFQNPGNHAASLDAANLASGVYFCRLVAGPFSVSRRMVLIR
jgi:photosystem II stability/assembly factor-like uncharacterized protein